MIYLERAVRQLIGREGAHSDFVITSSVNLNGLGGGFALGKRRRQMSYVDFE